MSRKINIEKLKNEIEQDRKTSITLSFREFTNIQDDILTFLGHNNVGLAILSDSEATIFFDGAKNVAFIVTTKHFFTKNDFPKLSLTIKGAKDRIKFFSFLKNEVVIHWKSLILLIFIFAPFLLLHDEKDFIKELNTAIISATAILVGVFLVFVTFFYLGRSHDIKYFSEGRFYIHFKNDKYIITSALISLLSSIISIGLAYYKYDPELIISINGFLKTILSIHILILSHSNQQMFAGILTLTSILFFWITFHAMIGYYFTRIKNSIYLESISKIHDEYIKEKTKK